MSLALLFTPQGSQVVGMGRELAEASPAARTVFEAADAVLGWSVSDTCWNGPDERLSDTRQTQPCLVTTSIAALRALEERAPIDPAFVAGHSVGEYAALVAAGVLDFAAALRLVSRRAELMAAADDDGAMAAVLGLDRATVGATIEAVASPADLVVANDNAPGQVVISGRRQSIAAATDALRAVGARRVLPLPVSGAFHSPFMADVADRLAEAFERESWSDARVPVVSNVTAEPETNAERIRSLLAEQVRSPVEWVASIERLEREGVDTVVELGPGSALVGMVRRIAPEVQALAVGDAAALATTVGALASQPAGASA